LFAEEFLMRFLTSKENAEFEVWASAVKEQMLRALQKTRIKHASELLTESEAEESAS
jgi:hypothetical protein